MASVIMIVMSNQVLDNCNTTYCTAGGATKSDLWLQIHADVSNLPLTLTEWVHWVLSAVSLHSIES